jgi:hypothetical protein
LKRDALHIHPARRERVLAQAPSRPITAATVEFDRCHFELGPRRRRLSIDSRSLE